MAINWRARCEKLCRKKVMRNPWCERCGLKRSALAPHHGIFKSDQRYILNPFLQVDPTIQFCLCDTCHRYNADAPHVDPDAFLEKMGAINPLKVTRLREITEKPVPPGIDPRIIDWEKVHANIVEHGRPLGDEILEGMA